MERGFSTLELMIAFALLCIVFTGVAAVQYGTQYWTLTLDTSSLGLGEADQQLSVIRMNAAEDFQSASSTNFTPRESCDTEHLCYYTQNTVTDISRCAKYAETEVSWRVSGFPTSTIALSDFLIDMPELIAVGADCGTSFSNESWVSVEELSPKSLQGTPAGLDVFDGVAYVIENSPSRLEMFDENHTYSYTPPDKAALNAIDVARDLATGRTYAYIAATSTQLRILDVTDKATPTLVASTTLVGVPAGYEAGWRLQYYDRAIYIALRFMSKPSAKELHIIDVSNPGTPIETAAFKLNTSVYAILVRDQQIQGSTHRFAYLATTHPSKELLVLDVTNPTTITTTATCDLPSAQQGTALFILGNTLYFGRENVPSGGEDLYAFDASDPSSSTFCTPLSKVDINDDSFSRHVQGIRVTGDYLFVATNNTTHAHGKVQIRAAGKTGELTEFTTFAVNGLVENGIDFDQDAGILYLVEASSSTPKLHRIQADN